MGEEKSFILEMVENLSDDELHDMNKEFQIVDMRHAITEAVEDMATAGQSVRYYRISDIFHYLRDRY